jgi:AbrB family looped-hinge helix DNA binding protein
MATTTQTSPANAQATDSVGKNRRRSVARHRVTSEDSASMTAHTRISANGRIVIPAAMREKLGLRKDESVVMEVQDGTLRIESYLSRIRRIQAEFAHLSPAGLLASEELILERRQEALLENETPERARQLRRIRDGYESA